MTSSEAEQKVLKRSIGITVAFASSGVLLGLLSGSQSIVFDGLFSVIDTLVLMLALAAARLVQREGDRRFQYGYWHIEPMVLAFNGSVLMFLCLYAFINAVDSFLEGGRELELDWALGYAVVACVVTFSMYFYERRENRRVRSELLRLDTQSWFMSALIATALLVAFALAWAIKGTRFAPLAPYVDPTVLALLTLYLITVPIKTVRRALNEVLLITPPKLDQVVRTVMDEVVQRHGFRRYTSYIAKVGRACFVEIYVVTPADFQVGSIARLDAIRQEISTAIGDQGSYQWLIVAFTADERWI
ncbi:MAG TPA: cation diffusion facilitator family transporter [Candidatus Competibacteraceae bacterium]|nr:cation diffusion facilitator family transporter [Candidatus Competibacteraceae bacterium]HRZ07092.1 cation diffusion facilitator family transporter [Candidatus Competibacteraceae bacterium]HSA46948.1 cation diffusion facilitator family transporter [Candidatus Competibacteraceae bacterium]